LGATESGDVDIVNQGSTAIFVGFSGPIDWDSNCKRSDTGVEIAAGASCGATITSNNASNRFCAPAGRVPDCTQAQDNHFPNEFAMRLAGEIRHLRLV
jgi:hypothetical protein